MRNGVPPASTSIGSDPQEITLIQDREYRRLGCTIDFDAACRKYNTFRYDPGGQAIGVYALVYYLTCISLCS